MPTRAIPSLRWPCCGKPGISPVGCSLLSMPANPACSPTTASRKHRKTPGNWRQTANAWQPSWLSRNSRCRPCWPIWPKPSRSNLSRFPVPKHCNSPSRPDKTPPMPWPSTKPPRAAVWWMPCWSRPAGRSAAMARTPRKWGRKLKSRSRKTPPASATSTMCCGTTMENPSA